jgi:hypothetical protein
MDTSASGVGEVLAIFSEYWIQDGRLDINAASAALCESTTKSKDPGQYISSTLLALHEFASARPNSIDFLVRVYATAVDDFPSSIEGEYGVGPVAGEEQLSWWLVDETNFFREMDRPVTIETRDPSDPSNVEFEDKDVRDKLSDVLGRTYEWKAERHRLIVLAAIQARCFALGIVRVKFPNGYEAESLIDGAIELREGKLSVGDFVAGCMLLRGCAKSLTEALRILGKTDKLDQWKSKFKAFLCSHNVSSSEQLNGNDWIVKSNAAVSLAKI